MKVRHLFLLLVVGSVPLLGASEWRRLSSEHFDLYTDAPNEPAERVLRMVENFRAAFLAAPLPARFRHPARVRIVLYRYRRDFNETLPPEFQGRIGGYARPELAVPLLVLPLSQYVTDQVTPSDTHAMFHELVHALTLGACVGRALWFDEGTAEYFANCRLRDDAVLQGVFSPDDVQILREGLPMPLHKLLDPKTRWNEPQFYPEAWLFAHYCFHGGGAELRAQYLEFARRAVDDEPTDERAFRAVFGCSTDEMDGRLKRYITTGSFRPTLVTFDAANSRANLQWCALDAEEREVVLATVNLQSASRKARLAASQVIARYPESKDIVALQALMAVYRKEDKSARSWIDALARGSPAEPYIQAYAARLALLLIRAEGTPASAADLALISNYANRALELDGECESARAVLEYLRLHPQVFGESAD